MLHSHSPVYRIEEGAANVLRLAWYDSATPLVSGWAWGQQHLEGGTSMIEADIGSGKLFLFGPKITFRSQSHGTLPLLFNGIHYGAAKRPGPVSIRAVATSATREAANRDMFLDRIHARTGITLEPIGGQEEARLVHLAVGSRVDLSEGRWILVDLGGGSVEVSLVDETGILWSESYQVGTVRLLETLTAARGCHDSLLAWVRLQLRPLTIPPPNGYPGPTAFAATGGNIEAIARLALSYLDPLKIAILPSNRLDAVIHMLSEMNVQERIHELQLRPDRADVILPAALVYRHFAQMVGTGQTVVPSVGVKEGVLLDVAAGVVGTLPQPAPTP